MTTVDIQLSPAPYESPFLRSVTGPCLRPGGLERTQHALSMCRLPAGARVLDVGCGLGATVDWLRRWECAAFGLERSRRLLAERDVTARNWPFIEADAARLPFSDGVFDLVLAECVLSLIEDPARMLAECRRVTAPGAWLVLTDLYRRDASPAARALGPATGCAAGAKTREELATLAAAAGFEACVWEDHTDDLRRLAADLVWNGGSPAAFHPPDRGAAGPARLGFGLMIGRRKDG